MGRLLQASSDVVDFTLTNYRKIIKRLKKEYRFIVFEYDQFYDNNIVLMRHDIDASINSAVNMARIENEEGVRSTFFVHLHNDKYNPLEEDQYRKLKEIVGLNHDIGLHFDTSFYNSLHLLENEDKFEKKLLFEKSILEEILGLEIHSFSFHNPEHSGVLNIRQDYICGMINAYSETIADCFEYCSDSNGYWRFKRLESVIEEGHSRLHILLHPEWWTDKAMQPYDRIRKCVYERADNCMENYCDSLRRAGRINMGYTKV